MVLDHTQANNELKELTNQKGINLPPGIGQENSTVKVRLSKLYGAAFDEAYMNQMVADHNQDVSLFERQSQRGDDRDLRDWVAKTLPNIQEHLRLANSITGHLGDKNRL
jgi:putative membrane protein